MHNMNRGGKVKNGKILRARVELSSYKYDIVYCPGKDNKGADMFTRMFCETVNANTLKDLHNSLCHPRITRMMHFIKSRNLPYSCY